MTARGRVLSVADNEGGADEAREAQDIAEPPHAAKA